MAVRLIIYIFIIFISTVSAYASQDFSWGATPKKFSSKLIGEGTKGRDLNSTTYVTRDDSVWGVKVNLVVYEFINEKLARVIIDGKGWENWDSLVKIAEKRYAKNRLKNHSEEIIISNLFYRVSGLYEDNRFIMVISSKPFTRKKFD